MITALMIYVPFGFIVNGESGDKDKFDDTIGVDDDLDSDGDS